MCKGSGGGGGGMSRICETSICNIQRSRMKLRENYDVRSVEKYIYTVHPAILERKGKKKKVSEIKYQILYGRLFYSNEDSNSERNSKPLPPSQF